MYIHPTYYDYSNTLKSNHISFPICAIFRKCAKRNWMALPDIWLKYVTMSRYGPNYRHQFFWTTYFKDFLYQDQVFFKGLPSLIFGCRHLIRPKFVSNRAPQTSSTILWQHFVSDRVCLPVLQNSFPLCRDAIASILGPQRNLENTKIAQRSVQKAKFTKSRYVTSRHLVPTDFGLFS